MSEPYVSTGNTEPRPCRSCGAIVEHEGARGLYGSPEHFRPVQHAAPCGLLCFAGGFSGTGDGGDRFAAYRAGRLHGLGEHRPCPACTGGEPVAVDDPAYLAATEPERVAARAEWERADAERWANYRAMEAAEARYWRRWRGARHGRRSTARERAHAARLRVQAARRSVRIDYAIRPYGWIPVQAHGYVTVDGGPRAAWYYRCRDDAQLDVWELPAFEWDVFGRLPDPDEDWSAERWPGSEALDEWTVTPAVEVAIRRGLALYAAHVRAGRSR